MKVVQLELPDNLNLSDHEIKMIVAGQLQKQGKLTLGQAANLVGISKRQFMENMGEHGFSVFSDSVDDLCSDIRHA